MAFACCSTKIHHVTPVVSLAFRMLNASHPGTPLVMIQGLSAVKEDWRHLADDLAKHRPVVVFDNRGMGESTADKSEHFSLLDLAHDCISLIQANPWGRPVERVHVMGISMGGMIAQSLVLAAPHLVDRLVLGCTHYGGHELEPPSDGFLACFNPLDFKELGPFKYTARMLAFNYTPEWVREHKEQFHSVVKATFATKRPFRFISKQMAAIADYDVSDRVGSITSPTLVLHGTHDEVVPFANGKKLAAAIPGAALKCLDRCGHIFWDMDSRQSVRAVETFLSAACAELPRSRPTHARSKL